MRKLKEYRTTQGFVHYDEQAYVVESFDNPVEPDGYGWKLKGSALTELRYSKQVILWFWQRNVTS